MIEGGRQALALTAALLLGACASDTAVEREQMWDDFDYGRSVSVEALQSIGWNCVSNAASDYPVEHYDGTCGGAVDYSNGPDFTVFGVPRAAAKMFMRGGRSATMNVQIHASSSVAIAKQLNARFGRPEVSAYASGCKAQWRDAQVTYALFMNEGMEGFVTLFVSYEQAQPLAGSPSSLRRLWDRLRNAPCSSVE